MLPQNRTPCCPHLTALHEYAAASTQRILACIEEMKAATDTLPDDLKDLGEALLNINIRVLIESHAENLKLYSALGLQEITRAAIPPTQHKEE